MISKDNTLEHWFPVPENDLASMYDVHKVILGPVGVTIIMVPDSLKKKTQKKCIKLFWETFISYQVSEETFRNDCWVTSPENEGTFFLGKNSLYLNSFKETSTLFPDNALHFLLVGTNLITDILSTEYPTVTYCDP